MVKTVASYMVLEHPAKGSPAALDELHFVNQFMRIARLLKWRKWKLQVEAQTMINVAIVCDDMLVL